MIAAADVLFGEYQYMNDFIAALERMADRDTEIYIAQKIRYPEKERVFRERLGEKFDLQWITPDLLCSNLGKQTIYILKKR